MEEERKEMKTDIFNHCLRIYTLDYDIIYNVINDKTIKNMLKDILNKYPNLNNVTFKIYIRKRETNRDFYGFYIISDNIFDSIKYYESLDIVFIEAI